MARKEFEALRVKELKNGMRFVFRKAEKKMLTKVRRTH